jgi:hypothetical protein
VRHDSETIAEVFDLIEQGLSDYEIARHTPVSRSTIFRWRHVGPPEDPEPPLDRPQDECAYAYLLGMYLGDGWVGRIARAWALKIALDSSHPGITVNARLLWQPSHPVA